jgi:hypothetical protein
MEPRDEETLLRFFAPPHLIHNSGCQLHARVVTFLRIPAVGVCEFCDEGEKLRGGALSSGFFLLRIAHDDFLCFLFWSAWFVTKRIVSYSDKYPLGGPDPNRVSSRRPTITKGYRRAPPSKYRPNGSGGCAKIVALTRRTTPCAAASPS